MTSYDSLCPTGPRAHTDPWTDCGTPGLACQSCPGGLQAVRRVGIGTSPNLCSTLVAYMLENESERTLNKFESVPYTKFPNVAMGQKAQKGKV